jgi:hypothetical protein
MHGGDYAWILPDDTVTLSGLKGDWWHVGAGECSRSQLSQTMDGLIIVKSHAELVGDEISASGLVSYRSLHNSAYKLVAGSAACYRIKVRNRPLMSTLSRHVARKLIKSDEACEASVPLINFGRILP